MRALVGLALGAALVACGASVGAQPPTKVSRVGFLTSGFPDSTAHLLDALRRGLRDLGHVEGRSLVIEPRYGEAKVERLPMLAADLVRLNVDVIVAVPNSAIEAARQASRTIPIVMPIGSDPVAAGFVASLARPGANITGLSAYSPELNGKRLQFLREAVPKVSRVALLMSPGIPGNANDRRETESAARSLQLRSRWFEVRDTADLEDAFKTMTRERTEALVVFPGQPTLFANRKRLVDLAASHRLPAMYPLADYVHAGGLISYGVNNLDLFRRAAIHVDKILRGARPADLPVEQPTKFELVINLKTARQIGLTIPSHLMARADHVVQ